MLKSGDLPNCIKALFSHEDEKVNISIKRTFRGAMFLYLLSLLTDKSVRRFFCLLKSFIEILKLIISKKT